MVFAFGAVLLQAAETYGSERSQEDQLLPKPPVSITSFTAASNRIIPMPLAERIRRGVVPTRGICSIAPGNAANQRQMAANGMIIDLPSERNDRLMSGNGKMIIDLTGEPLAEQVVFHHERLLVPWKEPFEAPKIAYILPEVRKLLLAGRYREGLELSFKAATEAGLPPGTMNHGLVPAFSMKIDLPQAGEIKNYLRTLDFESGEIKVLWEDQRGEWVRKAFVSRPDNVVVQLLSAPRGQSLSTKIELVTRDTAGRFPDNSEEAVRHERDFNERRLIVMGHFTPDTGNIGYAGVTRIVPRGGTLRIENGTLVIDGAQSVLLLTRIEWYHDFAREKVDTLASALDEINPDYAALLARNREAQAAVLDRVSLDLGATEAQRAMSGEELLADQRTHLGFTPALLEKLFDMGRYWLMLDSGDYPPIYGHLNININLQIAPGEMGNLPEAMNAFYNWIEGLLPDSRKNAENIFGARGALFSIHPDQQQGVLYHFAYTWPHHYWISAGGWSYSPFWDHYLVTGDKEFLRNRVVPGLKEVALFYEDYLKETDERGNYIFVPSYSPENWPSNADDAPTVINADMDIMVCREVLTHLIEAAEILGTDADSVPKWKAMLAKMPPYLLDSDGALKEWAWPMLTERQDHRHVSHLYGVWPGDEIDPDRTPQLAKAAWLADRKRAQENASAHGLSHRGLAAARLKDDYLVYFELKQFLEQGYVGPVLTTCHNPYQPFMPDAQGAMTTLMMEMLVYSRPGVIELLPAVPEYLGKGSIKGMLARTFTKVDDLSWNMAAKTVDVTLSSMRKQDVTLIVRHGILSIAAPPGVLASQPKPDATTCELHLPQGEPVTLHLKIGTHKPSEWIGKVTSR